MENLKQYIEALIFTSEQSITANEIAAALKASFGWELSNENIRQSIAELINKYAADDYSFELV